MSTFFPHLLAEAYSQVYTQEEYDPTDMVLDYLIAEGYADDEDEAFDILEQLDGAVIQGIIDEVSGCGGKVDPKTGRYMNGESAKMMLSPKKKAEKMAERKEKEATKPDHFRKAAKMKRIAQNMHEKFDTYDLGEEFKRMDRGKIARQVNRLRASGKDDQASTLDIVSRKLNTPQERIFSTRTSRKNKRGGSEKQKSMHLQAKSDALADIKKYGLHEEVDTYDLVLDYLLDEGYADTEESALKIMSNMSEEWVDSIIEEAVRGSERSIGNIITGNDIRSVSRGKTSVYKKPNWQDRVETNVRRKMGKEGHRNPYQYGSELTKQARKSAERMNAIKNVEVKYGYDDDNTSIDREGYREVPTDYRARRRRASGR